MYVRVIIGYTLGLYRDNGKDNGNYYIILALYIGVTCSPQVLPWRATWRKGCRLTCSGRNELYGRSLQQQVHMHAFHYQDFVGWKAPSKFDNGKEHGNYSSMLGLYYGIMKIKWKRLFRV